jgi:antitoxin CcdA
MPTTGPRRSTNLTLDTELLSAAKALQVNLSRAAEDGIRQAVARTRAERWLAENRAALDSSNAHVDAQGLPLADLRPF